jgi:choline dehydrogenase-like flavoprotein
LARERSTDGNDPACSVGAPITGARVCARYGPYDFRTYSRDSVGVDWPISYEDVAPYYDRVEKLVGIFGAAEGIENSPDSPPGVLLPPPPPRAVELWAQMVLAKRLGIRLVPNHAAVLTRPINGRQACLYATPCNRGCSIRANFQSPTVLLAPALATGRLEIRTEAMVHEVVLNQRGLSSGVRYIHKATSGRHFVAARSVVLAASACETARLLLNSKSPAFPDGLANRSGQVGRNLSDAVVVNVSCEIPTLRGLPAYHSDGAGVQHTIAPWWGHAERRAGRLSFAVGYNVSAVGGKYMPYVGDFTQLPSEQGKPLYGQMLRERLSHQYGSTMILAAMGGMLPNAQSRCEIDPTLKDRWGIPVLRFHRKWGENELAQARHAASTLSDMILAMGGGTPTVLNNNTADTSMANGHEMGTARMGSDASNSVLNGVGHSWDVRNIYITDGAVFNGHADKHPTETILALAWRASDHLADSFLKREI